MTNNFHYTGPSNKAIETALRTVVRQCSQAYSAAQGALTERQMVEALRQALACGDFMVLVRVEDGAQCVSYLPFRREQELKAEIDRLQSLVDDCYELDYKGELVRKQQG